MREHLDVGENPPNGAIVYYWLAEEAKDGGDAHLPRFGRAARSSTCASNDKDAAAGAQARHQGGAEPLRLGHEVSRADQARLRPGAAAAQAAGARSREPAGPDRGARHLRRRSDGRRGKTQSAKLHAWSRTRACRPRRPSTPRSSPCTRSWSRRCPSSRRRSTACARMKRQLDEVDRAISASRERALRNRAAAIVRKLVGHRERDGRPAAQVGARRAAQPGRPQRHAVRHDRHDDHRRRGRRPPRRRRCRARSWPRSTARSPSSRRW